VYQTLINLMPPHDVYVEPFLGAAAIMRMKRPAAANIGIDLDPAMVDRASLEFTRGSAHGSNCYGAPRFEFFATDAVKYLLSQTFPPSALVYADPPYLRSTRATRRDFYKFEMTDAQHLELLSVLKALPCNVMISGYSSSLYAKELKGWHATAFQAATRGKPAAEWVWCNYPRPVELHDYRFLGDDFREREQIKRMKKRWVAKLEKMEPVKRQALLAAISATSRTGDTAAH
jgi:hypothetical protein